MAIYCGRIVAVSLLYSGRIMAEKLPFSSRIVVVSWPYRGRCYFTNFPIRFTLYPGHLGYVFLRQPQVLESIRNKLINKISYMNIVIVGNNKINKHVFMLNSLASTSIPVQTLFSFQ